MTDWQKIEEAVAGASEISISGRQAWLDDFFAGDDELKKEAVSLLAFEPEVESFLEKSIKPYAAILLSDDATELTGKQFGNYRIIREIGRGGMGAVFLAERSDGEFDQMVALKVIRQTLIDKDVERRFIRERQILANLNHPNIAKLLDGGVSVMGEPFLAMEYIEGESLIEYTESKNLSIRERLKLFVKVCSAVSYAHRNLIVHRDIKPSNMMVDDKGEPKLLDFGLAKAFDETLSDHDQTRTGQRALTPAYASPEQLRGENVTTASDIYSLGVVLYELIYDEKFTDREFKSRRVNENAEIKAILQTAVRDEPESRYTSVEHLSADIQRFLKGEPINARPNTFGYRTAKFIRRNKTAAAAAGLILLSVIAGIAATVWQARKANAEKEKAEAINAFLEQTLKYANPILSNLRKNGVETTVTEVLDEAAKRLDNGEFDSSPEVKAELERTVGATYYGQGKYQLGRKHYEKHIELLRQLYGENDPKMISGSLVSAWLLFSNGDAEEAEKAYRIYLPRLREEYRKGNVTAEVLADSINGFAYLRRTRGDSHEAEMLFRETLDLIPLLSGESRNAVASTRSTLASTIADQGRFDEALETARIAVEEFNQRGEADTPLSGFSLTIYGGFLTQKGDFAAADANLLEAESIFRKFLTPKSLWLGDNLRNQAMSYYLQGRFGEAIAKADETMSIYEESFGKHYDNYPTALIIKGLSLAKSGQTKDGEKLIREAVALRTETLPKEHFWVALANGALGECLTIERRFTEAEPLLRTSYDTLEQKMGPDDPYTKLAAGRLMAFQTAAADHK